MNTNDIRHIDFDVYRERAQALRRQAISEMLDGAAAWLAKLIARIGRSQVQVRDPAPCAADC
jgi:hypothetical protein